MDSLKEPQIPRKNTVTVRKVRDELVCAICLNYLQEPKLLTCAHSFCRKCLVDLVKRGVENERDEDIEQQSTISCPNCRKVTLLTSNDIDSLQTNFHLKTLVAIVNEDQKITKDTDSEKIKPLSKSEVVVPDLHKATNVVVPALPKATKVVIPNCKVHSLSEEYYCSDCSVLICKRCMMEEHKQHCFIFTDEEAESMQASLLNLLQSSAQCATRAELVAQSITQIKMNISSNGDRVKVNICDFFNQIRKVLNERENVLLSAVNDHVAKKLQSVEDSETVVATATPKLLCAIEATHNMIEGKINVATLITEGKKYADELIENQSAIEQVSEAMLTPDSANRTLIFQENLSDVKDTIQKLGSVAQVELSGELNPLSIAESNQLLQTRSAEPMKETGQGPFLPALGTTIPSHSPRLMHRSSVPTVPTVTPPSRPLTRSNTTTNSPHPQSLEKVPIRQPVNVIHLNRGSESIHPCGITVGNNDSIIVSDVHNGNVKVIASTGRVIDSIENTQSNGVFRGPCAVASDKDDNIYILDRESRHIYKLINGTLHEKKCKKLLDPRGIASANGKIFVTDWQCNCVHVFDCSNMKFLNSIGEEFLKQPAGIAIGIHGHLIVADQQNHCVWVLTQEGHTLGRPIGSKGEGLGELYEPYGIAVTSDGMIVVTERGNSRVSVFTEQGSFVASFGGKGSDYGRFNQPRHVCISSNGLIVVADEMNQRIQTFELFDSEQ